MAGMEIVGLVKVRWIIQGNPRAGFDSPVDYTAPERLGSDQRATRRGSGNSGWL